MMAFGIFFSGSLVSADKEVQLSNPTRIRMDQDGDGCLNQDSLDRVELHNVEASAVGPTGGVIRITPPIGNGQNAEDDQCDPLDDVAP
jgi:hypothetical protein